jgi:hypothetical protein
LSDKIDDEVANREFEIIRINNALSSTDSVLFGKVEELKTAIDNEAVEDTRYMGMFNDADVLINDRLNGLSTQLENESSARDNADASLDTRMIDFAADIYNANYERKAEDVLIRASVVAVNEGFNLRIC